MKDGLEEVLPEFNPPRIDHFYFEAKNYYCKKTDIKYFVTAPVVTAVITPISFNEAWIIIDSVSRALTYNVTVRKSQNFSLILTQVLTQNDVENETIRYLLRDLQADVVYHVEVVIEAQPSNGINLISQIFSAYLQTGKLLDTLAFVVVLCSCLLSCHRTMSDADHWMICSLFIAITISCLMESASTKEFPAVIQCFCRLLRISVLGICCLFEAIKHR